MCMPQNKMVLILTKKAYEEAKKKGINLDDKIKKGEIIIRD